MRIRAARHGLALLAAIWAFGLWMPTAHADEGWVITSFHSEIIIGADSALTISEDIQVDFGSLQKHGIFRTIPLRYRYDDKQDRYYLLEVRSVTDGSNPLPYDGSVSSDN